MFMQAAESFVISDKIVMPWAVTAAVAPAPLGGVPATVLVETAEGWRAAGTLARGALVHTWEGGLRAITMIERVLVGAGESLVHLPGGAFGNCADMELSADQSLLIASPLVEDLFDEGAAVIPARALVGYRGITLRGGIQGTEMVRLGLDDEEGIFVSSGLLIHCAPRAGADRPFFRRLSDSECAMLLPLMAGDCAALDLVA